MVRDGAVIIVPICRFEFELSRAKANGLRQKRIGGLRVFEHGDSSTLVSELHVLNLISSAFVALTGPESAQGIGFVLRSESVPL